MSSAICVLGRGIERVRTGAGLVWRPTRFIEKLGDDKQHTGLRHGGINENDDVSVIAGANANVLAAAQLFEELQNGNRAPKILIFAAGRPSYLIRLEPKLTEGSVLSARFSRAITPTFVPPRVAVLDANKNTYDDAIESLRLAEREKIGNLEIITVAVHLPRTREFYLMAQNTNSALKRLSLHFHSSEKILLRRYATHQALCEAITLLKSSRAYSRTAEREQQGLEDLRAGRYDYGTEGYSFAKDGREGR